MPRSECDVEPRDGAVLDAVPDPSIKDEDVTVLDVDSLFLAFFSKCHGGGAPKETEMMALLACPSSLSLWVGILPPGG